MYFHIIVSNDKFHEVVHISMGTKYYTFRWTIDANPWMKNLRLISQKDCTFSENYDGKGRSKTAGYKIYFIV